MGRQFLIGCIIICTQPVTTNNKKRHNPYININLKVSPLGLLLFILVSHENTPALIQEVFFFPPLNGDIKIWKDHANPNGLLYNKVKMEITAVFLCKYIVKKLASNYIGPQYLFSKRIWNGTYSHSNK